MVIVLVALVMLLVVRTVWHALVMRSSGAINDALGRTSAAAYLAAIFMIALVIASRLSVLLRHPSRRVGRKVALRQPPKNPLRSRIAWLIAGLLIILLFPLAMLSTRLLLTAGNRPTSIPHEELARIASLLADPSEASGAGSPPYESPDKVRAWVHRLRDTGGSNVVVVAFEGTHTLDQWLDDFNVSSVKLDDCCRVHGGFLGLFGSMWPTLEPFLEEPLREVAVDPNARLILAGHSMGGAMAQLLAYQLSKAALPGLPARTQLMLFGSPTAGDASFVSLVASSVQDYANVVLPFDPIPFLADTTFPPIDRQVVVIPLRPNRLFVSAHIISTYAEALEDSGTARELIESCLFLAGLGMLTVGAFAIILASPLSRRVAGMYLIAMLLVIWQVGLRLSSKGAGGYVLFAAGMMVLLLSRGVRREMN